MRISQINNISKVNNKNFTYNRKITYSTTEHKQINELSNYKVSFKSTIFEQVKNEAEEIHRIAKFHLKEAEDIKNDAKYQADMAKFAIQALLKTVEEASKNGYQTEYQNGKMHRLYEMHNVNGEQRPRAMYQFGENGTLECILDITDINKPVLTQNFHGSQYIYELENCLIKQITLGSRKTDNTESFSAKYQFENGELTKCIDKGIIRYSTILEDGEEKEIKYTTSDAEYTYKNGELETLDQGKYESEYGLRSYDKSYRFNKDTLIYSEGFNEHDGGEWGKLGTTIVLKDKGNGRIQPLEYDEGWNYERGILLRGKSLSFDENGKLVRFNTGYTRELKEYAKSKDWIKGPKEYKKQIRTIQGHNIVRLNGIPEFLQEKFDF